MNWLGVDTGGTFTDFVCLMPDGQVRIHKVLSTPEAPERAVLQGIAELALPLDRLRVVHGSTVATNAALEGKGVRTVFVTNRGFADMLSIGRQNRLELYNLMPDTVAPPVPPERCLETGGRLAADGEVIEPLSDEDIAELAEQLRDLAPDAVAINLLFSYLDPALEQRLRAAVPEGCFCALSSEVLPEVREYERGMATWLNAWVGPLVAGYLARLREGLAAADLSVMQSAGDTVDATQAAAQAVRMLLSGPAGGLVGARHVAALSGQQRLLTFDMGGTSTDVALIDGDLTLTTDGHIGPYPVAVPMMDMHTIGAGGGSIVWVDEGGMLQVGPQSAGAAPGPACYGRGGQAPTVTDANLLLGRLRADAFLGGGMQLDAAAAQAALRPIAQALAMDVESAARAVIDIANAHMARALRAISIKRGVDPQDFALVSFGGAGGLHVCELAEALDMQRALVPVHGGVLSALGMLAAQPGRQLSRTLMRVLDHDVLPLLETTLRELEDQACAALQHEGHSADHLQMRASADLRYLGQSYTLNVAWQDVDATVQAFHQRHVERYGHAMTLPVELVTLRLSVSAPGCELRLSVKDPARPAGPHLAPDQPPVYQRDQLKTGQCLVGPAVLAEQVATTWVAEGWQAQRDEAGNLLLSREH